MAKEETKKTREELLYERMENIIKQFKNDSRTAKSIARDSAEKVVELLNCESDVNLKKRNEDLISYKRWGERAEVLEEAAGRVEVALQKHSGIRY